MRFSRNSLLALLTVAALGVLAAVALARGGDGTTTPPRPTSDTDPPAQTRAASSDDDGTADQGPGDFPATPRDAAERRHDADDGPNHEINNDRDGDLLDDHGRHGDDDGPNHDIGDDHGGEGGNSGPGSSNSGHGGGGGNSGHGGGDD
jgi:uncharacterized membrane protein YgcG